MRTVRLQTASQMEALLGAAGGECRNKGFTDGAPLSTGNATITGREQYRGSARPKLSVRIAQISTGVQVSE